METVWRNESEIDSQQFDLFHPMAIQHSESLSVQQPVEAIDPRTVSIAAAPVKEDSETVIEDAGAELTYNRRNRVRTAKSWTDLAGLNDTLKVKEATKANFWPKPDYPQMIKDGMHPIVAHIVKQVYDGIPSKPMIGKGKSADEVIQTYINAINRVETGVMEWTNDKEAIRAWSSQNARIAGAMIGRRVALMDLSGESDTLLTKIYPQGWKAYADEIRVLGGNSYYKSLNAGYDEITRATKAIGKGWPEKREAWQVQGMYVMDNPTVSVDKNQFSKEDRYLVSVNEKYIDSYNSKEEADAVASLIKPFVLFGKRGMLGSFDSEEEATEAAKERTKRDKGKVIDVSGTNVTAAERKGVDRRMEGENISSEKLLQTFGFRGVNFGNWMKTPSAKAEAQLHLNHAYDAFMDLADVLELPPKAMSLGGMLGVAIGAQGGGGTASAHFVPGLNELAITRTTGAGWIAHEWGHALDHYWATQAGLSTATEPYLSEHATLGSTYNRMVHERGQWVNKTLDRFGDVRPEIVDSFKSIVQTMNKREETQEEANRKQEKHVKSTADWLNRELASVRRSITTSDAPHPFDDLAERIRKLDYGDGLIAASAATYVSPVVVEIRDLFKKEHGRVQPVANVKALQGAMDHAKYLASPDRAERLHTPQPVSSEYASRSSALDSKKGGKKYWSTDVEKFARAFDAFVGDALEARGAHNTYLSTGTWNDATLPVGAERKAINAAFQALLAEVQIKETERGPVMFSLDDTPAQELAKDQSNSPIFYSALQKAFETAKQPAMPGSQWLTWLNANAGKLGLKKDEITWTGIEEYLELNGDEKLTKEEVALFAQNNGIKVQEVINSTQLKEPLEVELVASDIEIMEQGSFWFADAPAGNRLIDKQNYPTVEKAMEFSLQYFNSHLRERNRERVAQADETKFSEYTLFGGKNYRELLLTLPDNSMPQPRQAARPKVLDRGHDENGRARFDVVLESGEVLDVFSTWSGAQDFAYGYAQDKDIEQNIAWQKSQSENFKSSHWDVPNVVAHIRFNDRIDAEGKRVLFIEELQSDWGQQGKKRGFVNNETTIEGKTSSQWMSDAEKLFGNWDRPSMEDVGYREWKTATDNAKTLRDKGFSATEIPSAPFVTDTKAWLSLGVKRMIRYAAENDYDKVAFINGEQSADRYDLSKKISRVQYEPVRADDGKAGTYEVYAYDMSGKEIFHEDEIGIDRVEEVLGKDITKKFEAREGAKSREGYRDWHNLEGLDLQVGGDGMKTFYDKIVPQTANEVLKKLNGPKLVSINIKLTDAPWSEYEGYDADHPYRKVNAPTVTGFEITPELRSKALSGLPLFSLDATAQLPSLSTAEIWTEIEKRQATWLNMPEVIVLETASQLPFHARPTTNGALQDGRMFLVAENLHNVQQLQKVLAHECVGHYALEEMLGEKFGRLCDEVQALKKSGDPEICAIAADIQSRYNKSGMVLSSHEESAEIIARSVERCLDSDGEIKVQFGWIKGLYADVAHWLRDKEITVPFSNFELQGILANAGAWVKESPLEQSNINQRLKPACSLDEGQGHKGITNAGGWKLPEKLSQSLSDSVKSLPANLVGHEPSKRYVGAIVAAADGYVVQHVGKEVAVHQSSKLERVPAIGESVAIRYDAQQRGDVVQKIRPSGHTR